MAAIDLDNVGKLYPGGTRAVGEVDLAIEDGEFLVLVGPSGCGKSTILRMIAGLEEISEGKIAIGERVVNDVPPKDRDIAMVFQNYALYPHMTVYDNMAFGLKLRKLPKQDIDERVREAADILELADFLDRRPRALSGGQRQRVAMGRAIVRNPAAFLMDEPLSNLDAKLRVQMRTSLHRLHNQLGTTTVYVTHDQVEAMTLGDRVAVLRAVSEARPHNLQQVAAPTELFHDPVNLFVAGFIGSPAMNLVYVTLSGQGDRVHADFGPHRLDIDRRALERHPGIESHMGRRIVMGIRPGDFEDVRVTAPSPGRELDVTATVVEMLGAESFIHFDVDVPPVVTPEIEELLADSGGSADSLGEISEFAARVSSDVRVREGEQVKLVADTSKVHFFDPSSGSRLRR